jgi:alcohol dehydrogenase class IV
VTENNQYIMENMEITPFCRTQIEYATIAGLKERLLHLDVRKIAVFMSESAALRWEFPPLFAEMRKKYSLEWIKCSSPNPTQESVRLALRSLGGFCPDCAVAIGGGSVIDLAKAVCALWDIEKNFNYTTEEIDKIFLDREYMARESLIDIIAVPTTAGSGSELTQWGSIWDINKKRKYSVDIEWLKPVLAIICPELTSSVPVRTTLATGLDSLAHALEAFWSKRSNPLVRELAKQSVALTVKYLKPTLREPDNLVYRRYLRQAALLSALAFSQTRTTAPHSISYPLTLLFGIEHGFAVALTLAAVYEINRPAMECAEELEEIFSPAGLKAWLDEACAGIINLRLSDFGVREEHIALIAGNAYTAGRMDNNPVEINEAAVAELLKKC